MPAYQKRLLPTWSDLTAHTCQPHQQYQLGRTTDSCFNSSYDVSKQSTVMSTRPTRATSVADPWLDRPCGPRLKRPDRPKGSKVGLRINRHLEKEQRNINNTENSNSLATISKDKSQPSRGEFTTASITREQMQEPVTESSWLCL